MLRPRFRMPPLHTFTWRGKPLKTRGSPSLTEMIVITNNDGMPIRSELRPPAPSLEESAYTALLGTADRLQTRLAEWLKPHGLSPTQYNALRILRGAGKEGLPCSQIGERMLTHDPDITRLLDRLARRGWVARAHDSHDRRIVRAHITKAGLALLAKLDRPLGDFVQHLLAPVGVQDLRWLRKTCEALTRSTHPSQEGQSSA